MERLTGGKYLVGSSDPLRSFEEFISLTLVFQVLIVVLFSRPNLYNIGEVPIKVHADALGELVRPGLGYHHPRRRW